MGSVKRLAEEVERGLKEVLPTPRKENTSLTHCYGRSCLVK